MNAPQQPSPTAPPRPTRPVRPAKAPWVAEVLVVAALALSSLWPRRDLPPERWPVPGTRVTPAG